MADYKPKVIFGGDASGAIGAVNRLKSELGGLESLAKRALSFGVGAATVSSVISMTKAVIDQGDELNKMSQKTGVAVEELSKYRYIADLSGVSNEALTKGLTALAVGMTSAATGVGDTADQYQKFGINVRNADGTMKSSGAVLAEWADKFAAMPDGVDKTNLAVDIFGKKLGAEMIPMLNLGAAGIKAMGDEAESLGLVMGADLAKKSEEFNDNLDRMKKLSSAVGMEIASTMVPALNEFMTQAIDARKAGLGFLDAIVMIGLSNPFKPLKEQIADIDREIEKLRKGTVGFGRLTGSVKSEGIEKQISDLEKLRKYYELQDKRQMGDGVQTAEELSKKRIKVEAQLQTKLAELAKLRSVAEGKASADILDTDNKRIAAQIANAQKLKDALSTAWKQSLTDAQAAGDAAKKLFDQAADTKQSGADKAAAKRRSTLSPEDQQKSIQSDYETAAAAAAYNAALAATAYANSKDSPKRAENAAKLAAQAVKDAERAAKLADQIDDPEASAQAIERASAIQSQLLESQAKAKQQEQKALEEQAKAQADLINGLDKQITDLQNKAAAIKVEADIEQATGELATLQAQLDNLKDKTVTVTVNTTNLSGVDTASGIAPGTGQQFAWGGWTGPGGKWQPAGIVHAEEFVNRREVVRQPGALAFLTRFNQIGMAALKGYANGGLVQNLRIPSIAAPAAAQASANATFNFPGMGSYAVSMQPDVMGELTTAFQRQALKKGHRK